jgi:hypothetical protein
LWLLLYASTSRWLNWSVADRTHIVNLVPSSGFVGVVVLPDPPPASGHGQGEGGQRRCDAEAAAADAGRHGRPVCATCHVFSFGRALKRYFDARLASKPVQPHRKPFRHRTEIG